MKRFALLAATLVLCGVAVAPAGAGARSPGTPATVVQAMAARPAGRPVTLHWLRERLVGFRIGPTRATGFGESRLTGFTRGCPECRWVRSTYRLSDHQPVDTATAPDAAAAAARRGGFCWPWQMSLWSGSGCWNDMSSWNWGKVLSALEYHPVWDPMSTLDRIVGCYHGAYQGFTGGVIGKQVVGIMIGMSDLVKVTPAGVAWSIIGGCVFHLYHR